MPKFIIYRVTILNRRKEKNRFFFLSELSAFCALTGLHPIVHSVFLFKLCFTSYRKTICTVKINHKAWNTNFCSKDWKVNWTKIIFILLFKIIFPSWSVIPYVPKKQNTVYLTNKTNKHFTKHSDHQGRTLGLAKWVVGWPYLPTSVSVKGVSKHCPNTYLQTTNTILTPCLVQSVVQYQLVWSFQIWSQWCVDGDISWIPHTTV